MFFPLPAETVDVERLASTLVRVKSEVKFCSVCGNVAESEICRICNDSRRDLTVIWIIEKLGHVLYTRKIICLEKQTFEAQEAVLYPLLALPAVKRACIDQTGLGCQFVERAKQKFHRRRVEGVTFNAEVKDKLAYKLRCAFEDRTIRIPDDRLVAADLRSIRKTVTAGGNIRFEGERQNNSHADRFWAASLALEAAATYVNPNRIYAQLI